MIIHHRNAAHRLLAVTVALGRGARFSIFDVMDEAHWYRAVIDGDGPLLVGGCLSGALEGLRRVGATAADVLSCPLVPFGDVMTAEDMSAAAGWLSSGLLQEADAALEQSMVTAELRHRGWATSPAHITSLVLAIAVVASHAGDHDRG